MKTLTIAASLLLSLLSTTALAGESRATSGPQRTALLELYTSEGCSSCPPADRWLSDLKNHMDSSQVIPLALHVDYWDYIGWQDPYANSDYTQRQRKIASLGQLATIYTPQFVLNGKDLRPVSKLTSQLPNITKSPATTTITLAANLHETLDIDWEIDGMQAGDTLRLVVTEDALSSKIQRGENAGRTLEHDHVVRKFLKNHEDKGSISLPLDPNWQRDQLALIGFVESAQGEIRQALKLALLP